MQTKTCIDCERTLYLHSFTQRANGEYRVKCTDCLHGRKPQSLPTFLFIDGTEPPPQLAQQAAQARPVVRQKIGADTIDAAGSADKMRGSRRVTASAPVAKKTTEEKDKSEGEEPTTRHCACCKQWHPAERFYKKNCSYCKACNNEKSKLSKRRRKAGELAEKKAHTVANTERLRSVKDGLKKCCCCEKTKPVGEFYTIKNKPNRVRSFCKQCDIKIAKQKYEQKKQQQTEVNTQQAQ